MKEDDKLRLSVLFSAPIHFSDQSLFISLLYGKRDSSYGIFCLFLLPYGDTFDGY